MWEVQFGTIKSVTILEPCKCERRAALFSLIQDSPPTLVAGKEVVSDPVTPISVALGLPIELNKISVGNLRVYLPVRIVHGARRQITTLITTHRLSMNDCTQR